MGLASCPGKGTGEGAAGGDLGLPQRCRGCWPPPVPPPAFPGSEPTTHCEGFQRTAEGRRAGPQPPGGWRPPQQAGKPGLGVWASLRDQVQRLFFTLHHPFSTAVTFLI